MTPIAEAGIASRAAPGPRLDVAAMREEFPILSLVERGRRLVYLDNAATTQKPRAVIDAMLRFYATGNANVHRGIHRLSERATAAYEGAREKARALLHAADRREIVFVRGATEAINLVAQSYGRPRLRAGEEILLSVMEHHADIVPWQMLSRQTGAVLRAIPMTDSGELCLDEYERLLNGRTRLVAVTHVSNVLGTVNPAAEVVARAHARGVPVLLDGAQAVSHMRVDVRALDADFYVFSGHKMFGPTGIGVLYGKAALLDAMPPYQGGGDMIRRVSLESTEFDDIPGRFEAGTPHIAGAIGLGAAIDYVASIGWDRIAAHERELLDHGTRRLAAIPGLRLLGTARAKAPILTFVLEGVHPHDIGTILDEQGVAVRTGHHCCQPLMHRLGVDTSVRASLAFYNTLDEIDALAAGLERARRLLG